MLERRAGSSSIEQLDYWWYRARADLLQAALGARPGMRQRVLDVGSADGPSVAWLRGGGHHVSVDMDPRGLVAGEGVCASALSLPFAGETFDVLGAFDVIEHCEPEATAIGELVRVLVPGGLLLISVPAYQWAWSDHDVRAGHHRRYTLRRIVAAVEKAGLIVRRSTYGFAFVFPFFVAARLASRLRRDANGDTPGLPPVPAALEKGLLALTRGESLLLRSHNLPFGSSIFVSAVKPVSGEVGP